MCKNYINRSDPDSVQRVQILCSLSIILMLSCTSGDPSELWDEKQGCGSGSVLDPYSIESVDPDPDPYSESGSRRAKMTHKSRKIFFRVLACIFIKLSTSNYCTHKINKYSQHYPPSPPQGGDGFDHCIIYGMRLTNYTACHVLHCMDLNMFKYAHKSM